MNQLPIWMLTEKPAFNDHESFTVLEASAKVYAAMRDLIAEYNKFAQDLQKEIESFTGSSREEIENFKEYVEKRLQDRFNSMDQAMAKISADMKKEIIDLNSENVADMNAMNDAMNQAMNQMNAEMIQRVQEIQGDVIPYSGTSPEGSFLRVVNGVWTAVEIQLAEEVTV